MHATLGAPNGGFRTTTTFVSGVDSEGTPHEYGCWYTQLRANAVITKGAGVSWVAPTATVPVSVKHMTTSETVEAFAGVALDGATAAGQYIRVCHLGFCLFNANAQTAAAGEILLKPGTNNGELTRAAAPTFDAAAVAGQYLGQVFGVKNATTLLALCFIKTIA